jgi:hypothetical protein
MILVDVLAFRDSFPQIDRAYRFHLSFCFMVNWAAQYLQGRPSGLPPVESVFSVQTRPTSIPFATIQLTMSEERDTKPSLDELDAPSQMDPVTPQKPKTGKILLTITSPEGQGGLLKPLFLAL